MRTAAPGAMLLLALGACTVQVPYGADAFGAAGVMLQIPATDADGHAEQLTARICLPHARPAPVAIIAHGAPAPGTAREAMQPARCDSEVAQWFSARGYLAVFALRRGFGASTGPMAETSGPCDAPDYVQAGLESARDIDATVRFAQALPQARPDGAVVVGQSTGGWAVVAYDTMPHPGVAALVSMAGGRGGHALDAPDTYCRPDLLVAAAGHFGAGAREPMLWVYARNDSFFDPALATRLHAAYMQAGGRAVFAQPAAFDDEGHALFNGRGGSAIWGPLLDRYLAGRLGS